MRKQTETEIEKVFTAWKVEQPVNVAGRLRELERDSWDAVSGKIRAEQEKKVFWARADQARSAISLVYIHGFSGGPLELEPTIHKVAQSMGANLFVTRLKAHGLESGAAFKEVKAEEWIVDVVEALAIGHVLGKKVVLVGMSTGAALALVATEAASRLQPEMRPDALILLSPNFRLARFGANLLLPDLMEPLADPVMRLVEGDEHQSQSSQSELQTVRWTLRYPIEGAVQLMRVLRTLQKLRLNHPAFADIARLVVYTPRDTAVSVSEIENWTAEAQAANLTVVRWEQGEQHELASRAFSPGLVGELVAILNSWIEKLD